MTVIVEDGNIITGANSYVTEAEVVAYASARGTTILLADAEQLIVKSMDYIESLAFIGIKATEAQPLQWPRYNATVDGYLIDGDEIPSELTKGQLETVLAINAGNNPLDTVDRLKESVSVGSLSVTYVSGSTTNTVKAINNALKKLLASGGGSGISFTVKRG